MSHTFCRVFQENSTYCKYSLNKKKLPVFALLFSTENWREDPIFHAIGTSGPSKGFGPPSTTTFLWGKPAIGLKHFQEGISDLESGCEGIGAVNSQNKHWAVSTYCRATVTLYLALQVAWPFLLSCSQRYCVLQTTGSPIFASIFVLKKFSIRSSWSKRPILSQHSQLQIFHLFLWLSLTK